MQSMGSVHAYSEASGMPESHSQISYFYTVHLPVISANIQAPDGTTTSSILQKRSVTYYDVNDSSPSPVSYVLPWSGNTTSSILQKGSVNFHYVNTSSSSPVSYILSESGNTKGYSSCAVPINQLGTYRLNITNNGGFIWNKDFSLYITSQRMERPFFYWGILGLMIALGYLILLATGCIRRGKPDNMINESVKIAEN